MERSKRHIDFLDQIRGVAIVFVFLYHCLGTTCGADQLPWGTWVRDFSVPKPFLFLLPLSFGWSGVAIFFVVSGFCIHLSFVRKPDWRDFCIRRAFRIYPPYLFAVILFALLIPWSRVDHGFRGAAQLFTHLALVHNFNDHSFYGISPAFWSIAVEAQLYVLYPVLLVLVSHLGWRRGLIYVAALEIGLRLVSSIALTATGEQPPLWFSGLPFLYWFSWSVGAAVGDAYVSGRPIPFSGHSLLAWSCLAVGSSFFKPLASFSFLFFAVLTASAIAKLLNSEGLSFRMPLVSAALRTVGLWSFSIYLLHQPFLQLAPRVAAKLVSGGYAQTALVFILCVCLWIPICALSALWYRVFELSSISLGRRLAARAPHHSLQVTASGRCAPGGGG